MRINVETNTIIREGNKSKFNPFDAYAVEAGLRIKEEIGGSVTVISMGVKSTESILREALAMGADDAVLLNDKVFAGSDTLATSYVLSKGIEHLSKFDLIICGRQSIDGDTAQVGPELAQKLSIPHITCVFDIEHISTNRIRCKRVTDFGYEMIETSLPALITVVKGINEPRIPRIKDKLRAKNIPVHIWNADKIEVNKNFCGLTGSPTKVVKTFVPDMRNKCNILEGSYVEQAKRLLNYIMKDNKDTDKKNLEKESFNKTISLDTRSYIYDDTSSSQYRGVCLFVEYENKYLSSVSIELLGTGKRLAESLGVPLSVILLGENISKDALFLAEHGADIVYMTDNIKLKVLHEEIYADILIKTIEKYKPEIMLFGASTYGKSLASRVASALNTGLTADCTKLDIDREKRYLLQTRPAFGGNLVATIVCPHARPQMATVRPNVMKDIIKKQIKPGKIIMNNVEILHLTKSKILKTFFEEGRQTNLNQANIIVSMGKGIGTVENIHLVEELAKKMGGAIGATRALVDLGWVDYNHQIGQTGKTVVPQTYLAIGISGAIQHIVGMANSKKIIAINKDRHAPIFGTADYGIVADAAEFIPILMKEINISDT
ncbi:FAD-binding protein [Anaerocolumna cellulosilytica]|nr:FAD-binding protein [Anaerocolumna cellulosilytica]MBB5193949.1 electron transfer flavoprotein alpha subunit [Anaerocolumna cellulosilytica]